MNKEQEQQESVGFDPGSNSNECIARSIKRVFICKSVVIHAVQISKHSSRTFYSISSVNI